MATDFVGSLHDSSFGHLDGVGAATRATRYMSMYANVLKHCVVQRDHKGDPQRHFRHFRIFSLVISLNDALARPRDGCRDSVSVKIF